MSTRQKRRQRFIAEHPFCCYCGGDTPAVEIDHNPARSMFSVGAVPIGFRFPCCADCNDAKIKAESRAALISTVFSLIDPPDEKELRRSVERGLGFIERDAEFLAVFVEHPTHTWDFARGAEPSMKFDPLSPLNEPHVLPESFGHDMFELGRYFGQAMYYRETRQPLRGDQIVGVTLFTNALSREAREAISPIVASLDWQTPATADRNRSPEFGLGIRYFPDSDTLFFAGERRASFLWFGLAGAPERRRNELRDYHWWRGNGARLSGSDEV